VDKVKSLLRKFCCHHNDLDNRYRIICVTNDHLYVLFVETTRKVYHKRNTPSDYPFGIFTLFLFCLSGLNVNVYTVFTNCCFALFFRMECQNLTEPC